MNEKVVSQLLSNPAHDTSVRDALQPNAPLHHICNRNHALNNQPAKRPPVEEPHLSKLKHGMLWIEGSPLKLYKRSSPKKFPVGEGFQMCVLLTVKKYVRKKTGLLLILCLIRLT